MLVRRLGPQHRSSRLNCVPGHQFEGLNGVEMQGGVDLDPEGDQVGISEDEMGELVEGDIDEGGVEGDEDEMMHDRGMFAFFFEVYVHVANRFVCR